MQPFNHDLVLCHCGRLVLECAKCGHPMMAEGDVWWDKDLSILPARLLKDILEQLEDPNRRCRVCDHDVCQPSTLRLCWRHNEKHGAEMLQHEREQHKQQHEEVKAMLASPDAKPFHRYLDHLKEKADKLRRRSIVKYQRPKGRWKPRPLS